ncbi:MAG TPA: class I SAM-dependent methyltransferase [Solirubrobacteraceae bacterium]|nr:class I SAM-dependent methyltransferase [Solirubrobacteraceae bacterium]
MSAAPASEIERRLAEAVAEHGEWTAHNIHLGSGVYTRGPELCGEEVKLRQVVQTVADMADRPFEQLRILDLGCLEGQYAIELALHGAQVVGIDGREANLAKAAFARDVLGLSKLELLLEDVRSLERERHGGFDVVLCWGLLYHLPARDVFDFIARLSDVCDGFALIDTHISLSDDELGRHRPEDFWVNPYTQLGRLVRHEHGAHDYWGRDFREHAPGSTQAQRRDSLWASLDNETSFWLTRPSLLSALMHAGFTSAQSCVVPPVLWLPPDRATILATKGGAREPLLSTALLDATVWEDFPE